jgi:hypothetical protein
VGQGASTPEAAGQNADPAANGTNASPNPFPNSTNQLPTDSTPSATAKGAGYNGSQVVAGEKAGVEGVAANSGRPSYLSIDEFAQLPESGTIDPRVVRHSQDSASASFKRPFGSVDDFIDGLSTGQIKPSSIKPIRIV